MEASGISLETLPGAAPANGYHGDHGSRLGGSIGPLAGAAGWGESRPEGFAGSRPEPAPPAPEAWAQAAAAPRPAPDEVLAGREFFDVLAGEQRRSDRTKAPLSLVVLRLADDAGSRAPQRAHDALLKALAACKRETDYLGAIDHQTCAVLFPNTPQAGTERFARQVGETAGGLDYTLAAAAYPTELFRDLRHELAAAVQANGARDAAVERHDTYVGKRALDLVGASLAILLTMPLMLAVALAIRFTSPGPIIFRQTRLGAGGKSFEFYKFRSMTNDIDDRLHREFVAGLIDGKADENYKLKSDPRITRIGRFIRKTSIDELPQLFNILKGDMSLVGPRPPIPYEVEKYKSWHLRRILEVQPGLTGIWQVEGRSRVSFDEMVRMDIRYTKKCSLLFDIKILLKTVRVVLSCEGAS